MPKHSSPLRISFTFRTPVQPGKSTPSIHLPALDEKTDLDTKPVVSPRILNKEVINTIEKWLSSLPEKAGQEMSSVSDKYSSAAPASSGSPHRSAHGRWRFRSWTITPRRLAIICGGIASFLIFELFRTTWNHHAVRQKPLYKPNQTDIRWPDFSSHLPHNTNALQCNVPPKCAVSTPRTSSPPILRYH